MKIKDSVIIITGASAGIGLATAKELANKGAKVVLAARSGDKLKELEKEIEGSFAVVADMRKPKDIVAMVDAAKNKFGRIDILVNNAGQGMRSPVEKINIDDYTDMRLNQSGAWLRLRDEGDKVTFRHACWLDCTNNPDALTAVIVPSGGFD